VTLRQKITIGLIKMLEGVIVPVEYLHSLTLRDLSARPCGVQMKVSAKT
jgi:hypothetical protein